MLSVRHRKVLELFLHLMWGSRVAHVGGSWFPAPRLDKTKKTLLVQRNGQLQMVKLFAAPISGKSAAPNPCDEF
jgi:hypothetical protein